MTGVFSRVGDQEATQSSCKRRSVPRRAYDWFCGFDDTEAGLRKEEEQEARLRKITSLEQSRGEKLVLHSTLVCLLACAVFLYLFFSFGSDFGMYH